MNKEVNRYHHHFVVVAVRNSEAPYDYRYYIDDNTFFGDCEVWDSYPAENGDPCGTVLNHRKTDDMYEENHEMYRHLSHLIGAYSQEEEPTHDNLQLFD